MSIINHPFCFSIGEALNAKFMLFDKFTNAQIISAVIVIILAIVIGRLLHFLIKGKFKDFAENTKFELDDLLLEAVDGPLVTMIYLIGIFLVVTILNPAEYRSYINKAIYTLMALDITWLIFKLIEGMAAFFTNRYKDTDRTLAGSLFPLLRIGTKVFVAIIAFILIVQNLGYSVSSLLAGLGIGGLAVALAAKDTLANIFGSLNVFLDKPFLVGDWIVVEGVEGIVEDISFRCTRIRTWKRTQVSIPNSVIANKKIENYSRRPSQRISTTIGVTYDTPPALLEEAVKRIRQIILDHPDTDKNTIYIYFSSFNDSSLGIFMYFFIDSPVWNEFMKARHEIFISIMKIFEELGVNFAFPSRSIYMENTGKNVGEQTGKSFVEKSENAA